MSGGHDFRYANLSGGAHHLGDKHATYNLFSFSERGNTGRSEGTKFERRMLVSSDPDVDLWRFRIRRGPRVGGTCSWLWDSDELSTLFEPLGYNLRFVTGPAGTGKTEAALYLLDTIAEKARDAGRNASPCVCHFFFSSKDVGSSTELELLRSLLFQLCRRHEFLQYMETAYQQYSLPGGEILDDTEALWLALIAIMSDPAAVDVFIVLDAADTLPQSALSKLCGHLELAYGKHTTGIKIVANIIMTCRNITSIPLRLRESGLHLQLRGTGLQQDLRAYITAKASELSYSMAYSADVKEEIIGALQRRNGGTFLWLAIVMRHLQSTRTKAPDVLRRLSELPQDLSELYSEILAKVPLETLPHVHFLFHLLCTARRQVSKDDILLAFCLHQRSSWHDSRVPDFWRHEYLVRDRTDLILYDPEEDTFNFLHDTVSEYLTGRLMPDGSGLLFYMLNFLELLCSNVAIFLSWGLLASLVLQCGFARLVFHVDNEHANFLWFRIAFRALGLAQCQETGLQQRLEPLSIYSASFLQIHASASWATVAKNFPWTDPEWSMNVKRAGLWLKEAARLDARCLKVLLDTAESSELPINRHRQHELSSLLAVAAQYGNTESMEILLARGANPNPSHANPLRSAATGYHADAVQCLINHGADVDSRIQGNESLLLLMLGAQSETLICDDVVVEGNSVFVGANEYYSSQFDFHGTAFFGTAAQDRSSTYEDVVMTLILASTNLEVADNFGRTALIRAAVNRQWRFVQRLIDLGANVNAADTHHVTPLLAAVRPPRRKAVFENITVKEQGLAFLGGIMIRRPPLSSQVSDREADGHERQRDIAISALIKDTNSLGDTDEDGRSALLLAAEVGQPSIVRLLLDAGADIHATDAQDFTALMLACQLPRFWHVRIQNLTVRDKARVYTGGVLLQDSDRSSNSAHQRADHQMRQERRETVKMLLQSRVAANAVNVHGDTALSLSITDNQQEITGLLLASGAWNAPFDRARESMASRFVCTNFSTSGSSRVRFSGSGQYSEVNNWDVSDDSHVHFGTHSSKLLATVVQSDRLNAMGPLCPIILLDSVSFWDDARGLLGVGDLASLNSDDAHNFDDALSCPVPFHGVQIRGRGRWHVAADISPDWDPLCRPLAIDFSALPRCRFDNVRLQGEARVEMGNSVFVKKEDRVFVVTSQYPGNSFENITVRDQAWWVTSAFTAGEANPLALEIFRVLEDMYLREDGGESR